MALLRRLHAIELLDIPRCPRAIRDGATDYLRYIIRRGNAYGAVVPLLAETIGVQNITSIVDHCSGGGGPWPELRTQLVKAGAPASLRVTLTDLYPNVEAFASITAQDPSVTGCTARFDVERDSFPSRGLRTMFSAFHHFPPRAAAQVLRHLAQSGDAILIAEVTRRAPTTMLFMLLAPLLVWLTTPQLRPFRWTRVLLTYALPAIPFVVCHDGIVSCVRTYGPDELRELLRSVDDLPYDWQVGCTTRNGPLPVTYALGLPRVAG